MSAISNQPSEVVGAELNFYAEPEIVGADWGWLKDLAPTIVESGGDLASSIWGKKKTSTTIINEGMPSWALPVGLGVGGLALVGIIFAMKSKKGRRSVA